MIKRTAITIIVVATVSVAGIGLLLATSGILKENVNSFLRLFPPHPILEEASYDLEVNSYYIAGTSSNHVYLGNYTAPLNLMILDGELNNRTDVQLAADGITEQKFWSVTVLVDSPYFFIHDGAVPKICEGHVNDWTAKQMPHVSEYFLDIAPMGGGRFFIKSLSKQRESILGKISADSPYYEFKDNILKKQIDGFFCTDGTMAVNEDLGVMSYVYRYRNQFMVLDSNLTVKLNGNTIDTTSIAKISVSMKGPDSAFVLSSPPLVVNSASTIYRSKLLIKSGLRARNEQPELAHRSSVIDVYDLSSGKYIFSFVIDHFQGIEKLRGFRAQNGRIFALFDRHIQTFKLQKKYFDTEEGKDIHAR
jgi:hypothetical protein